MILLESKQPLAVWRKIANMTQQDLADAVGVDRATVSQWECGRQTPHAGTRAKIEQVLNINYFDDVVVPKQ